MCQPWWLEPIEGLLCVGLDGCYVSALVAVAHRAVMCQPGGCSPWGLLCVSLVAVAHGGPLCVSLGGWSQERRLCSEALIYEQ